MQAEIMKNADFSALWGSSIGLKSDIDVNLTST